VSRTRTRKPGGVNRSPEASDGRWPHLHAHRLRSGRKLGLTQQPPFRDAGKAVSVSRSSTLAKASHHRPGRRSRRFRCLPSNEVVGFGARAGPTGSRSALVRLRVDALGKGSREAVGIASGNTPKSSRLALGRAAVLASGLGLRGARSGAGPGLVRSSGLFVVPNCARTRLAARRGSSSRSGVGATRAIRGI